MCVRWRSTHTPLCCCEDCFWFPRSSSQLQWVHCWPIRTYALRMRCSVWLSLKFSKSVPNATVHTRRCVHNKLWLHRNLFPQQILARKFTPTVQLCYNWPFAKKKTEAQSTLPNCLLCEIFVWQRLEPTHACSDISPHYVILCKAGLSLHHLISHTCRLYQLHSHYLHSPSLPRHSHTCHYMAACKICGIRQFTWLAIWTNEIQWFLTWCAFQIFRGNGGQTIPLVPHELPISHRFANIH